MVKSEVSKKKSTTKKATTKKTPAKKTGSAKSTTKKVVPKKDKKSKEQTKKVETKKVNINSTFEENNYTKTVLAAVLIILVLVAGYVGYQIKADKVEGNTKQNEVYIPSEDEKRFKEDYESINGTARSDGSINRKVSIIDDNNIVYISLDQVADIIATGSGVIYFGFAACPWCRNAVPVLLDAMSSSNLDKIYYVDVRPNDDASQDIREKFELVQNKVKRTKVAASPRYDEILEKLGDNLSDYILTNETGKEFFTGKKRLSAPTVVAIKNGVVVDIHIGTVDGHIKEDGVLPDLTKDQSDNLYNMYSSLISKYLGDGCNQETGC